jgi:hypothetical protein
VQVGTLIGTFAHYATSADGADAVSFKWRIAQAVQGRLPPPIFEAALVSRFRGSVFELSCFFVPFVGKKKQFPLALDFLCHLGHPAKIGGLLFPFKYRFLHDMYPLAARARIATQAS